jgi:hypothetical protein
MVTEVNSKPIRTKLINYIEFHFDDQTAHLTVGRQRMTLSKRHSDDTT